MLKILSVITGLQTVIFSLCISHHAL